jgi:hypothetical protein
MKRDLDLIRLLLLEIEKKEEAFSNLDLSVPGYTSDEIDYNLGQIIASRYVDVSALSTPLNGPRICHIRALTPAGHDYLDAVRKSKVWAVIKDRIAHAGVGISVEVIKELSVKIAKEHLGL